MAVGWWQLVDDNWLVAIGWWQLVGGNCLVTVGGWQLVGGSWLVTVGWWQLVGGNWWVAALECTKCCACHANHSTCNAIHSGTAAETQPRQGVHLTLWSAPSAAPATVGGNWLVAIGWWQLVGGSW